MIRLNRFAEFTFMRRCRAAESAALQRLLPRTRVLL